MFKVAAGWKVTPRDLDLPDIEVLPYGCPVVIGDRIQGHVTTICIRGERVSYEVSYWDGGVHHSEYLEAFEVRPVENQPVVRIGFRTQG